MKNTEEAKCEHCRVKIENNPRRSFLGFRTYTCHTCKKSTLCLSAFNKCVLALLIAIILVVYTCLATTAYFNHQFSVFYSLDKRENDQEVIKVIDGAQKFVYFAVYTFTKEDIAQALIRAKGRGLIVWGITDTAEASTSYEAPIVKELTAAGITVETQKHLDGIMHIKAIVTDKQYAMGSYNWTDSATQANDELLEVSSNQYLREQYLHIIERILETNQP